MKQKVIDGGSTTVNKSKILIKIAPKNKSEDEGILKELRELDMKVDKDETRLVEEEGKTGNNNAEETNIWNLRPQKLINKCANMNGDGARVIASVLFDKNKAHSPSRNLSNISGEIQGNIGGGGVGENKVKKKLSVLIALMKEVIEEDIFSMTRSKPARRPKKRAKNIQKSGYNSMGIQRKDRVQFSEKVGPIYKSDCARVHLLVVLLQLKWPRCPLVAWAPRKKKLILDDLYEAELDHMLLRDRMNLLS